MEIKAGDYLLTKENQLFRITEVHLDTKGTYYDIKSTSATEVIDPLRSYTHGQTAVYLGQKVPLILKSVPRNVLRHMGKVIPQEKITKMLKILYG